MGNSFAWVYTSFLLDNTYIDLPLYKRLQVFVFPLLLFSYENCEHDGLISVTVAYIQNWHIFVTKFIDLKYTS